MIIEWFNAREAASLGCELADLLATNDASHGSGHRALNNADPRRILQRAVRESQPPKLNVFKRARLLSSFKWRLLEKGFDQARADELTHVLLLQLGAGQASGASSAVPAVRASRKRIDPLLAQVDADFARGDPAVAVDRLREVVSIEPTHSGAHYRLGVAFFRLGRYAAAEDALRRAIQLNANEADAHFYLGTVLRWRGDIAASETALRRAIKQNPRNAQALVGLGHTLASKGRLAEAKECLNKAFRLEPRSASVLCGLGWAASMEGHFAEAEKFLRTALEVDPQCAEAWALLADVRRMTPADSDWIVHAQQLLAAELPRIEEARLRFAMGKYFDDVADYAKAFAQYKVANELQQPFARPYDKAARETFVKNMLRAYSGERLAQSLEGASESEQPIFVIGMMRSGTSLVEQIIASHPRAAGAGEVDYWNALVHKQRPELQRDPPDSRTARDLVEAYLKVLTRTTRGVARIVDKATMNSDLVGLLHLALPHARFIYLRRDPVDTCLSCYFQNFVNVAAFTMDLKDLAHYYRGHHQLVSHWRSVLPKDVFLEVPYAELVADQEAWSRRIIEFIGLDWDPNVLAFEKTERAVLTASSWQVRQKIYSSSVGRWKHYQKFIGPLLKLHDLSP